eukprot:TRINITY_DN5149_c0_g1_i1.p1 TRINITY_DN5149_c0_g1~~TRINITY_DN5149_c0_g1_i1.p1  ORF type:complete len:352 (+),score=106.90 TRINITY_DN5149_c0_g1_i1:916-1971(+)
MKAVTLGPLVDEDTIWHSIETKEIPKPQLKDSQSEVVVKISVTALNHRDVFIRQELYPNWKLNSILASDAVGTVIQGPNNLVGKRVVLHPMRGWKDDPRGPDGSQPFGIRGGADPMAQEGTLVEYIKCPVDEIELAPEGLTDIEAASIPLAGLTAYRALFTKCDPKPGYNLLVTGIGGGVALFVLQFAIAAGLNVWVTSGSQEKIDKAVKLGAKGGVSYKDDNWNRKLKSMLPKERPFLDAVVDSAGSDILSKTCSLMRTGGVISCYGMTTGIPISFQMIPVLKNVEVKGSTMGSAKEFKEMVKFVSEKKIKPVVSHVFPLDRVEEAFQTMKQGQQFGKIAVIVSTPSSKV